ncbi:MAG: class II aldolase [Chloroflexi bacterium]|nr:class II aldolase [Chloroflexota bacterium]
MSEAPTPLVELTRTLGQPHLDYVIIGEGNTSCRADDESFWVKASGQQMHNISPAGFVQVRFDPILAMLDKSPGDLAAQKAVMQAAKVDPSVTLQPSVEVSFHAMLLRECGVSYIGHTHAMAVNRIMCSPRAADFASKRMFPDEAVLCGPESVFLPYVDPGLPLAVAMRQQVRAYLDTWGDAPKVILMANHGVIALGQTPTEVLNVMAMCVKAAHIFIGACVAGGPVFMEPSEVLHICRRPDEIYRRQQFVAR